MEVGSEYLLEALERGAHAASDYYETAALSRVITVGCRRCGGGLAGEPFVSNVLEGAEIANGLDTRVTLFDGSGAAMPPVQVERRVLVAGANQDPEYIVGFLGTYRLLLSDLVLLTMSEEPMAGPEKVRGLVADVRRVRPDLVVIPTVFRPRPVGRSRGCGSATSRRRRPPCSTPSPGTSRNTTVARSSPPRGISPTESVSARTSKRCRGRSVSHRDKGGGGGRRYAPGFCGGKARLLLR